LAQAAEADGVELAAEEAAKPSRLKPLIFILVGFVLAVGATLGTLLFLGVLSLGGGQDAAEAEQASAAVPQAAIYVDLDPEFTVNFRTGGRSHFLQIGLSAMTRDSDVEALIKRHMPAIRNDLMVLFGTQRFSDLATREGKERLQAEALKTIQKVLDAEGAEGTVEAVYFTSFVMQ